MRTARPGDSKSLWNYTQSPGWNARDLRILNLALRKYGCSRWALFSRLLPKKTQAQLCLQTQRIVGQQSLREFTGLRLHFDRILEENQKREGKRKGGMLINEGSYPSPEEWERRKRANKAAYGLSKEDLEEVERQWKLVWVRPAVRRRRLREKRELLRALQQAARSGDEPVHVSLTTKRRNAPGSPCKQDLSTEKAILSSTGVRAGSSSGGGSGSGSGSGGKARAKAKRKAPAGGAMSQKQRRKMEESDSELARRLQAEEAGYDYEPDGGADNESDDATWGASSRRRRSRK